MRSFWKNVRTLFFGLAISFVILEIFLRIYNPFNFRVRGDRIILPANMEYVIENPDYPQLDDRIVHRKNSIGFRGPEPPDVWEAHHTAIVVGGSTTECFYLNDGKDWPAVVQQRLRNQFPKLWVNNAGLDGHSTFGHRHLLDDYVLKKQPSSILFLIGANDIGLEHERVFDSTLFGYGGPIRRFLVDHSEVVSTLVNLRRLSYAHQLGVQHGMVDLDHLEPLALPPDTIAAALTRHETPRQQFGDRLKELADMCRKRGIEPVFITQPVLWGDTLDPVTGKSLSEVDVGWGKNGLLQAKLVESYNGVTRHVADEHGITLIDLAARMPKSTEYFYDTYHYTNAGAEKVAEIVSADFRDFLSKLDPL